MSLVQKLKTAGIVKTGEFILKSGQKSNIYFDFKGLLSHPKLVSDICYTMSTFLPKNDNCYVAGVPMGGISYATGISLNKDLPQLLIRESVKEYGMGNQIEGLIKNSPGRSVILVEDVITTGGSVQKFIDIVEAHQLKVAAILCIMDRGTGVSLLRKNGYTVHSLFTMDDFGVFEVPKPLLQFRKTAGYELRSIALRKKSNIIVALDLDLATDVLNMIDLIGDHVVGIKLHGDSMIYEGIDDYLVNLKELKQKYNLLLIEDRKFADIPVISEKQYQTELAEYADVVTVHGIIGPEQTKLLGKHVAILLVHQLSAKGNLIDRNYSNSVAQIGYDDGNVVGFVSQEYVHSPNYSVEKTAYRLPTFSPGANLDATTDGKGQQYTAKKEADYIIVGRGITEAEDPLAAVIRYKEHYWNELCDGNDTPIQFG